MEICEILQGVTDIPQLEVEQIRDAGSARQELARVFGHEAAGHAMLRRVGVQSDAEEFRPRGDFYPVRHPMEERLVKLRFALLTVLPTA